MGLLAWLLERWRAWGDSHGDPERVFSREHMITTAMIYWNAHPAGGHFGYYENPQAVVHALRAMFRALR
jgi:microsomal epoxide hydrolase